MNTIKFSFRYKKMPHGVEFCDTWIMSVKVLDYADLTDEEIKMDTETVDGEFYVLPKTKLIWIDLFTDCLPTATKWQTIRRWTPEKERYYRSIVGQEVKIVIEDELQKTP